jgi:hypothetical protein
MTSPVALSVLHFDFGLEREDPMNSDNQDKSLQLERIASKLAVKDCTATVRDNAQYWHIMKVTLIFRVRHKVQALLGFPKYTIVQDCGTIFNADEKKKYC